MALRNFTICDLASIASEPPDFLPIFFLILQENLFVLKIFPYFDNDVVGIIHFASNVKGLNGISDIPYGVGFSSAVFDGKTSLFVVFIDR